MASRSYKGIRIELDHMIRLGGHWASSLEGGFIQVIVQVDKDMIRLHFFLSHDHESWLVTANPAFVMLGIPGQTQVGADILINLSERFLTPDLQKKNLAKYSKSLVIGQFSPHDL